MARVDGSITNSVRLAVALRYFAGGLPYNITITYDISFSKVFFILWRTANAVNCCPEFAIEYSTSHNKQLEIEKGFQEISTAGFKCCACAVDAMLIWIHERSTHCCQQATCQEGNSSAAGKEFGRNLQAVADVDGCFLDTSIM